MKDKLKNWKYKIWNEPNPEGVTGKEAFCILFIHIGMLLILINLTLWLNKPEQSWIGDIIFPMAK